MHCGTKSAQSPLFQETLGLCRFRQGGAALPSGGSYMRQRKKFDSPRILSQDVPRMAGRASALITKRTRGYLPHWEHNDGTYFVTFRLGDSLPKAVLEELLRQKRMLTAAKNCGRKLLPIESVTEKRLSSRKIVGSNAPNSPPWWQTL